MDNITQPCAQFQASAFQLGKSASTAQSRSSRRRHLNVFLACHSRLWPLPHARSFRTAVCICHSPTLTLVHLSLFPCTPRPPLYVLPPLLPPEFLIVDESGNSRGDVHHNSTRPLFSCIGSFFSSLFLSSHHESILYRPIAS